MKVLIYTVWPVRFWQCPASHVQVLRERFPGAVFSQVWDEAAGKEAISDADVALSASFPDSMLKSALKLRWVHSTAAAVGSLLPLPELASRGIVVTNSRGIQSIPIAEHVMGGLLMLARRFDATFGAQHGRRWIQNDIDVGSWPRTLHGRSMTIIGLGSIGQEVARRAHAFGMAITGVRRRPDQPRPAFVDRVFSAGRLDEALRGCDVLVISAPFLEETDRLIRSRQLALLNRGAIVVNVARGQIVEEGAMVEALRSGHLGGAVLDVFENEPLDTSNPLWVLPSVIVTPHCSGYRPDHWNDVVDLFSENLRRFERDESLLNVVDRQSGY